jgi:hypothetical protein
LRLLFALTMARLTPRCGPGRLLSERLVPDTAAAAVVARSIGEPFAHGKFQVGPFETKVHAGQAWKGRRGIISFYVNQQMFDHFQKYGRSLYDQWAPRQDWYERPE